MNRDQYYRQKYLAERRYSRMLELMLFPLLSIITFLVLVVMWWY